MMDKFIVKLLRLLPDKQYLSLRYYNTFGCFPNWKKPQTFNEKLQWLKMYDHNPEYTKMVDKVAAKQYVTQKLGEEYIIPTLGVWERAEDIDWDLLPNQFVLKCNHDSGGLVICKDKLQLDKKAAIEKLKNSLKTDFYKIGREWPYKNVPRNILAEKFMSPAPNESDLHDYKFFCFNGEVKFLKVDYGRFEEHHANYYDIEWNLLPFSEVLCPSQPSHQIKKPTNYDRMLEIATELSKNIPFVRVDLYNINGKIYVGELTFYPASGLMKLDSDEWDRKIGEMLTLPRKKI